MPSRIASRRLYQKQRSEKQPPLARMFAPGEIDPLLSGDNSGVNDNSGVSGDSSGVNEVKLKKGEVDSFPQPLWKSLWKTGF